MSPRCDFSIGKQRKARKRPTPRCSERASVSLSTPQPISKGSGEAYQSCQSDHATATEKMLFPAMPAAARPPVSASATSCCSSADGLPCSATGFATPPPPRIRPLLQKKGPDPFSSRLLQPALLLVVLGRAVVQRSREAVLHHGLRVEHREGRMQLLELVE